MDGLRQIYERLRAIGSFLRLPLAVVVVFAILSFVIYDIDSGLSKDAIKGRWPLEFLQKLFGEREATRSVLSTLSSALITVTSITFSMLLVAVQQGASSFSSQILDQFLKRRSNQFYFGFFVGLGLFTLVTLATTHGVHLPLFGALFAILGTVVALCMILVLIYTTVQQMRSGNVVGAIVAMTRKARQQQLDVLRLTRAEPTSELPHTYPCRAQTSGRVTSADVSRLARALRQCAGRGAELVLKAAGGSHVGKGELLGEVRSRLALPEESVRAIESAANSGIMLGPARGADEDPRVGIHQLATIGWNSASSARSNPEPPSIVCHSIGDLVWDWTGEPLERDNSSQIVYPDEIIADCIDALDTVVVAAAESKQHQTLAQAYETFARVLPRLPPAERKRAEEGIRLSLGALGDHFPTVKLNNALATLEAALRNVSSKVADEVQRIRGDERRKGEFSNTAAGE